MLPSYVKLAHMLLPNPTVDLSKWAVVACDQYTSQPEYWKKADAIVGDSPSTLRITLPEVYLEEEGVSAKIAQIHQTMQTYLANATFSELPEGMILTERWSGGKHPRRGIVLSVDLEAYSYEVGATSPIRPTEKTVVERIPPRLQVRKGASVELPHIMLLIDDASQSMIEPLFTQTASLQKIYDTDLMLDGGHITGWFVPKGELTAQTLQKLDALGEPEHFQSKYNLETKMPVLPFAVGDGNHSMATAKAYWEEIKQTLSAEEQLTHPARFALVEIVNIHDPSLTIEPIHRVLFQVDADNLLQASIPYFKAHNSTVLVGDAPIQGAQNFPFCTQTKAGVLSIQNPPYALPLATLQAFLDDYLATHPQTKIDYIHGQDVVQELGTKPHNIGFLLPDIEKQELFRGVILDGVLPRKTFSMGEAHEKRFYMEAKRIVTESGNPA